jgi:hypothetical protein
MGHFDIKIEKQSSSSFIPDMYSKGEVIEITLGIRRKKSACFLLIRRSQKRQKETRRASGEKDV